jgi:G3E family GTPase
MNPAGAQERKPILLITGFLGSGKTTLINGLLDDPGLSRTLVLVNEFGQVAIDTDLITRRGETMVELSNGCVCCTLIDDLGTTLYGFLGRRATGELPPFDRVLIETTGLANVGPIVRVLQEDERVREHYQLDRVITTVDAVMGMKNLDLHAESVEQVALADRLVMTKLDRVPEGRDLDALRGRLRTLNASAEVLNADRGRVDVAALLGGRSVFDVRAGGAPLAMRMAGADSHGYHDHGAQSHDHEYSRHCDSVLPVTGRHDAHIASIPLVRDRALSLKDLQRFWKGLEAAASPNLLRVKGLVQVAEMPDTPVVIQGVHQIFDTPVTLPAWPSADRRTRIVFIGWMLDRQAIEEMLP